MKTKFHPMLYSTPMVQAIVENRKTKTRRTKGLEKVNINPNDWKFESFGTNPDNENDKNLHAYFTVKGTETWMYQKCPYNVGDVLWVRENFYTAENFDHWKPKLLEEIKVPVYYQADIENYDIPRPLHRGKIRPNIFLPAAYSRFFLKIKSIRVERLQDISEDDAKAEGAKDRLRHSDLKVLEGLKNWKIPSPFLEHQFGFLAIWCSINGCDNWIFNPYVWVYEFEQIEKPNDFI